MVALSLAILSAGAGHGDYASARALFPLPMLLTLLQGDTIGLLSMISAVVQYPLYGALIMRARLGGDYRAILVGGILHVLAVATCFSGALPNFS
jgi:hypothetical protein